MRYTQDEFIRLIESVEDQGGQHLEKTHDPVYHTDLTGPHAKGAEVNYCGADALFAVPYTGIAFGDTLQTVEVCAVDDMMGWWPRFRNANAKGRP